MAVEVNAGMFKATKCCGPIFSLIAIFGFVICWSAEDFDPNAVSHTTKSQLLQMIENDNEEILIYFYTKFEDCPDCKLHMPDFQEAAEYLNKLEDGKIKSFKLAVSFPEYGVASFPQLIFFRGKIPFRYDMTVDFNPDEVVEWVENAKQTSLPHLTDESFEHLTQASTGATTGDWLILFANHQRADCLKPNLPDLASVAVRLRGRKNVAVVDISSSPVTAKRFNLDENECVKLLFFHRTDLYHYKHEDWSPGALLKYVLGAYQDDEAMTVPPPHNQKSAQIESMIEGLRRMLEDHAQLSSLAFISGIGFGCLSIFALLLFILKKFRKRKVL